MEEEINAVFKRAYRTLREGIGTFYRCHTR